MYIHVWKWWVRDLRVYLAKKKERGDGGSGRRKGEEKPECGILG